MMKTIRRLALLCALVLSCFALTSCDVHFFGTHYDVEWYVIAIPTAVAVAAVTILAGVVLSKNTYVCPKCGHRFHPKWWQTITIHNGSDRLLRCPKCKHKGMCSKEN